MTRVRSMAAAARWATMGLVAGAPWTPGSAGGAQGAIVDEGAFRIFRGGEPVAEVEAFRITRGDNGQLLATSQLSAGKRHTVSRLTTDSVGTPLQYRLTITDNGVQTSEVRAVAGTGRLQTVVSNQRGDESQRDYPMGRERTVLLDDDLVHQLYFVGLSGRSGAVRVVSPHAAKVATFVIAAHGLEPIDVGGQSVTATHLSLANGGDRRDVWVDADGRVLRAETSSGLKAIRDELPKKR
jgi:hypothetical protein